MSAATVEVTRTAINFSLLSEVAAGQKIIIFLHSPPPNFFFFLVLLHRIFSFCQKEWGEAVCT